MADQFGGIEVDETPATPPVGRDEFGGLSVDDEALQYATTAPQALTGAVTRALDIGLAQPTPPPPGRRVVVTRAGVRPVPPGEPAPGEETLSPTFANMAESIQPGQNAFTRPIKSLAKTGLEFASAATAPENIIPTAALFTPAAPVAEAYFLYQMGKGAAQSVKRVYDLMQQTGPVDDAWKQQMSDAIVGAEAMGVGATAIGANLVKTARAKLRAAGGQAVPPSIQPTPRFERPRTPRTETPQIQLEIVPPPETAATPKPEPTPLATPEAEAAEQARLAAELGQEEEAPTPAPALTPVPTETTDPVTILRTQLGLSEEAAKEALASTDSEKFIRANLEKAGYKQGVGMHEENFLQAVSEGTALLDRLKAKAKPAAPAIPIPAEMKRALEKHQAAVAAGQPSPYPNVEADTAKWQGQAQTLQAGMRAGKPDLALWKANEDLKNAYKGEQKGAAPEAKPAETTPATPTPTGPDAIVIAGKPLSEWFKVTDASDLPKGEARADLAKRIGVANQPKKILDALKNSQDRIRRRIQEISAPPMKPEEALPATTPTEPVKPTVPEVVRGEGEPRHPLDKFLLAMGRFIGMQQLAGGGNVWRTPLITKAQFKQLAIEADKVGWTPVSQIERKGKGVIVDFQPKPTDLERNITKLRNRIGMLEPIAEGHSDFGMQIEGKPVTPDQAQALIKETKAEILKLDPIVEAGFRDPSTGQEFHTGPLHKWVHGMPTDQAEIKKLTQGFFTKSGKFMTRAQVEDLTAAMPHAGALDLEKGPVSESPKPQPGDAALTRKESPAVPAERAKPPVTPPDVDVPDLVNQATQLAKGVDLDAGERSALAKAIEAARTGNPEELLAQVEKLKELSTPPPKPGKVVRDVQFGGATERVPDVIDWLEGAFPGGVHITSKSDYGELIKEKSGAARKILFTDKGASLDQVMRAAELSGQRFFTKEDEIIDAIKEAGASRTEAVDRARREEQMIEDEANQVLDFQKTALRNRGRTAEERAAAKPVDVSTLNVGDVFFVKGERFVVKEVTPDGDVITDDGKRFGQQALRDEQKIHPDRGEIIRPGGPESIGPGAASREEFRARENRRRVLADIAGYLFGDRAGEVTDALLRKLAGEAVPKTMALSGEAGNKMVRFAAATQAAPHMARAHAREVFGDRFNDRAWRRRLGAVLVEDRLRAIRRGFLQAARDATDPAEQARLWAQANDVNSLVGPGRVFETEADFRRELTDPEIRGALQRWIQGPQYEAQLYHTTADGVLAGPGVNTGAFVNLSPIYESAPQAIFTSSRKGDYTRPFKRRSIFSRRAAGTAEVYELDAEPLLERMIRGNYEEYTKRELYDQLEADRIGVVLPPSEPRPTFDGRPAEKFPIKRQTLVTIQGGQTRIIPQYQNLWVHPDIAGELRQAEHIGSPINNVALARFANVINRIQLALGTDATWHIGNMFSKISGSQGGSNLLVDVARKVPMVNVIDTITRVTIEARRILRNDPEVLNQIAELAQIGNIRTDKPGTGWVTRGLNLLDKAGRVVLDDFYKNLTQRKNILGQPLIEDSEAARRNFSAQLGQYNPRLMGQLESFFKESGLSPFIVAAREFNRGALRKMTLSPGIRAANMTSAIQMRAVEAFGVVATLFAVPMVLNSITVGKPFGRPGVPIGAIDTGKDDANGKHIYIDPAQWIGLRRGMRMTGTNAFLEGMIRGQPWRQIKKQMAHDVIGAIAHPWAGPIVQMGSVLGTGYTTSFFKESKDPGDYWENFKAAMKQINPVLHGWFQRQGKGIGGGIEAALTTFGGAAGIKSRAPLTAINQIHDLANGWASRSTDPRIRSEYEQHAKESFSSEYQELRSALTRKDLEGAKAAYQALREKGKKPSVINETMKHPHPFTGSARAERMFRASLDDKERALYDQAIQERKQLYQAYRAMLNSR